MAIFTSPQIQALVSNADVLTRDADLLKNLWTADETKNSAKLSLVDDLRFRIDNHTSPSPVEQDSAAQEFVAKCFPGDIWESNPKFYRRYSLATRKFDPVPLAEDKVLFLRTLFDDNIALVLKPMIAGKVQVFCYALTKVENLKEPIHRELTEESAFELVNKDLLEPLCHVNSSQPIFYLGGDAAWAMKPWSVSYSDGTKLNAVWVAENPFDQLNLSFETFLKQFDNIQFDKSFEALGPDLDTRLLRLQCFAVSFFHDLFIIGTEANNTNAWAFSRVKVVPDLALTTWLHIKSTETENLWFLTDMHKHLKAVQRICFSLTRSLADMDENLAYYYSEASEIETGFAVSKPCFQFLSAIFKALVDVSLSEECVMSLTTREAHSIRNHLLKKKAHLFWRNLTNSVNLNLEDLIERKWWPTHAKPSARADELNAIRFANGNLEFSLPVSLSSFLAFGAPNPNPRIEFICGFSQDGPMALAELPILAFASSEQSDLVIPAEVTVEGKPSIAMAFCPAGSGVLSERGEVGFSPETAIQKSLEQRVLDQVNERHSFSGLKAFIQPVLVKSRTWEAGLMNFSCAIQDAGKLPALTKSI